MTWPPDDGPGGSAAPDDDRYDRLRRRVLWSMPTGLYVIGSRAAGPEPDDPEPDSLERAGLDPGGTGPVGPVTRNLMTANLVVQVATDPKLVAVAVDATAVTGRLIEAGGCFSISILDRQDRAVVRRFVKPVTDVTIGPDGRATAMAGETVVEAATGAPILARAAAWLDCEVRHRLPLGSHQLFVGEVVAVAGPDGEMPDVLRMEDTRMNYGG
jgi:flavin reductase (DIM6/NTAB) family NADH-FMN oxidoreductase RutF